MGWPTDKVSEFFGRGLWGWATSTWERLTSDGSGSLNVHIKSQTGTQLIQQVMPTLLKPGIHGYDGSAWQELSLLWGYTAALGETVSWTSDGSSPHTLSSSVVPAGEVWVVNSARSSHNNAGALALWLYAANTGNVPLVDGSQTLAMNTLVGNTQPLILAAGGKVNAVIYSLPTSQIIYLHVQGYKMAVA